MTPKEYRQEYLKKLGNRIREARIAKGLSQDDLAQALGYKSRSSINKIEHGIYDFPLQKTMDIANLLGVDVADLFLGTEPPKTKEERDAEALARQILRLDTYRRALIESIINTEPETIKKDTKGAD